MSYNEEILKEDFMKEMKLLLGVMLGMAIAHEEHKLKKEAAKAVESKNIIIEIKLR